MVVGYGHQIHGIVAVLRRLRGSISASEEPALHLPGRVNNHP